MSHDARKARAPSVILPPATIGILGGGQLGRMMALDGRKLGYRFTVLDPTPDCPTSHVADEQVVADFSDVEAARRLAESSDVVTYEFENVDADVAKALETFSRVPQGSSLLATTQHRVREKSTLREAGIPVTPFVPISSLADIDLAIETLGSKLVVKTCRGGYDGKGQWMVRSAADVEAYRGAFEDILAAGGSDEVAPLIAEQFVPFHGEISVVVARNARGDIKAFPPSENIHVNHILHLSIVPARYPVAVLDRAVKLAHQIASCMEIVGLIAVEMFVTEAGELFVNELAPRPHNSGHYTMDACVTSQFEQHIRAICNLPLGDVQLLTPVVMVNVLGQHVDGVLTRLSTLPGNVKVHFYGKASSRVDRKMGHLNILCDDVDDALSWIDEQGIWS
ncbi:5-(carboxyamino)imidazole ribonucleotide synthase [Alicyclobacillus fastidiosus]|uniref:N5-carboxyaminoimidazole ribonucleotide synthase n=1 Tax=Alicyclobacillus fastidiosus TaxID=392011 RepID=A0ABY6ZND6_9BACL|nr:5-(carboxyamino)imidazole ribonucleotide synthase [Alicyclobacillus fastidiosus]WAH43616.1 5-(carboxyamino)imidazole ribonucleotide synthase [Alicyclobacillus fastidiosus]GMA59807.1 N5-carboxyaminoimidazole ribonucleotide synthase [Alicyclobacillus fastidiosus]